MIEKIPDEKIIPITHTAQNGVVQLPTTDITIETLLIKDDVEDHYEHLRQHMFDEADVTLTAYHMYEDNALIFDLQVAEKNFRYIFKVSNEQYNILQNSKLLVVIDKDQQPIFYASIEGCQNAMQQLLAFILTTEASKLEQNKK